MVNDQTICSIDIMATLSNLMNYPLPRDVAQDSHNLLSLFYVQEDEEFQSRPLIHHSLNGVFAIRQGPWKLIFSDRSGGFSYHLNKDGYGIKTVGQLYNLSHDIKVVNNLYGAEPQIGDSLTVIFE